MGTKKVQPAKKAAPKKATSKSVKQSAPKAKTPQARGWETRKANAKKDSIKNDYINSGVIGRATHTASGSTTLIDPKPTGTITSLSTRNEKASLTLGANIGSLLQRMRYKLTGSEQPIIPMPERVYSPSEIIGALERTEDNTIESLTMLEQLDKLLEEML